MTTQADAVPSVDEYIETVCYGLWLVIQTANGAKAVHGNRFVQSLADRQMNTPMPDDPQLRTQWKMISELATMLARSNRQ